LPSRGRRLAFEKNVYPFPFISSYYYSSSSSSSSSYYLLGLAVGREGGDFSHSAIKGRTGNDITHIFDWRQEAAVVGLSSSLPMTRSRVLAVMLVTTLVATHSHSPWSSLLRDWNCRLPLGKTLCLLLLGFPTWPGGHTDTQRWRDGSLPEMLFIFFSLTRPGTSTDPRRFPPTMNTILHVILTLKPTDSHPYGHCSLCTDSTKAHWLLIFLWPYRNITMSVFCWW